MLTERAIFCKWGRDILGNVYRKPSFEPTRVLVSARGFRKGVLFNVVRSNSLRFRNVFLRLRELKTNSARPGVFREDSNDSLISVSEARRFLEQVDRLCFEQVDQAANSGA